VLEEGAAGEGPGDTGEVNGNVFNARRTNQGSQSTAGAGKTRSGLNKKKDIGR